MSTDSTPLKESVYRIQKMDCPTEEKLIRNKLEGMPGIHELRFNLMQRELTVRHELEDEQPILAALQALDMAPQREDSEEDCDHSELARSKANLDLERANAIPDPSISVGVREFRESNDRAFVAGLSIPIPVFNANGGNIAKARHEVNKTESDKRAAEITLSTELMRAEQELENAYRQAQSLKDTVIPAAEKAYSLSRQGYGAGKFPYLEVLDAQRTLVEARAEYNDTLKEYHTKRAEVERMTAKNLPATNQKEEADAE